MRSTTLAGARTPRGYDATFEYPSTARAGRHAARLWFEEATPLSPAQFRDKHFRDHCQGKQDTPTERDVRKSAFDQAFMEAVGHIVVEEGRFYALAA
ncbi:hypothetical protein A7J71_19615 [Achromobacter insolitus]|uniref:hypothetical protein n=1 Tax=Achromobacter insolitus TaxID=217204 RepID=UPI0007C73BE6|nr:hypothetical protein [Achromobacter insolitus]OAE64095.1 hypothetical protein A7J71_19615 [Achromobacter insolitus]OCZ57855.1 hypothetical protein A7P22_11910 [Achromobacter insolitus]